MKKRLSEDKKWQDFDKKVLGPYERCGIRALDFRSDANVFGYMQIRYIAIQAFKAGMELKEEKNHEH
jgi:hypothetical protein